jgi:hypothetical protein
MYLYVGHAIILIIKKGFGLNVEFKTKTYLILESKFF